SGRSTFAESHQYAGIAVPFQHVSREGPSLLCKETQPLPPISSFSILVLRIAVRSVLHGSAGRTRALWIRARPASSQSTTVEVPTSNPRLRMLRRRFV